MGAWRIIPVSKWLITRVIVSPLRKGLWDPFQMAILWLANGGDPNHITLPETNSSHLKMDAWNTSFFPFGAFRPIFQGRCHVSFREGTNRDDLPSI